MSDVTPPEATPPPPDPPAPPTIHEAERGSGWTGAVIAGVEISIDDAAARRLTGQDVVVCGPDTDANRRLAEQIEARVGPYVRSAPHKRSAGPRALPHFQQDPPLIPGHTFYETVHLRAARRKK